MYDTVNMAEQGVTQYAEQGLSCHSILLNRELATQRKAPFQLFNLERPFHAASRYVHVRIGEFTVFLEARDKNKTRDLEPCT
jgi:hypothetical protein